MIVVLSDLASQVLIDLLAVAVKGEIGQSTDNLR